MNGLSAQDSDSRLAALFQPDELAAHQYQKTYERATPLEPEKRLMLAILEDAVICFQKYHQAQRGKEKRLYEEAASWIFDRCDMQPFSFENVCGACGLDPDYLRLGLLNLRQTDSSKARDEKERRVPRNAMRHWGMRGHKR